MAIPNQKWYKNKTEVISGLTYPGPGYCVYPDPNNVSTTFIDQSYSSMVRQRPKPEVLLPTPATFLETHAESLEVFPCSRISTWSGKGGHKAAHYGELSSRSTFTPSELAQEEALLKAFSRLNANSMQLGETLGTLSQTGQMISRRLHQVTNIALALKSRNWKQLSEALRGDVPNSVKKTRAGRQLADGWLELEFGWKPLIQDVYTALDMYRNRLVEGQLANSRGNSSQGGFGPKDLDFAARVKKARETGANSSSKLYAKVGNANLATLNDLGLANPALTAWQLLPWSFVVDWVIPVSPILSSLTSKVGYDVEAECRVVEKFSVRQYKCGRFGVSTRRVDRIVSSNPDVPSPTVAFQVRANSIWHVATASALLRQRFGR